MITTASRYTNGDLKFWARKHDTVDKYVIEEISNLHGDVEYEITNSRFILGDIDVISDVQFNSVNREMTYDLRGFEDPDSVEFWRRL